ncbi:MULTISPECIES: endolytic transglycosylase MltG [Prosthecochloris]|uniref:Endolytic murein transglycosylase n=1 Tax=Prosthecochloris vibrioformis TaxID=1098 RepID=A0A5C4S2U8_PROVB|nr:MULTISPECIES: endolytic transglycosylase MltG [Prosthecochloris]ANT66013.1 putative aminodeoxychorismate lyase [Prosthecochloris sp. CIB 2401]TNJ37665.1 endolytic transglycosylase MltG [Prosthecochloris vibrioformis]
MPNTPLTRVLTFLGAAGVPTLCFLLWFLFSPGWNTLPVSRPYAVITVQKGESIRSILGKLRQHHVIKYERPLLVTTRLFSSLRNIKPGRYTITTRHSNYSLLEWMHQHPQDEERIMIPPGLRMEAVSGLLGSRLATDSISLVKAMRDPSLLKQHASTAGSLEGYLLPGTYNFAWAGSPEEVLETMLFHFRMFYDESLQAEARQKGLTELEVLTLASIVEAETPLDEEKPLIASVYLNRLAKGMKLQADPTVQYALGRETPERILYRDLDIDSPYNTYRHKGLPPGPICSPGKASIRAVLFPAESSYLYFVATGNGGHYFARTHSAHLKNVSKYRRNRE